MSILVFLEQRPDGIHPMSWEALTAGQELSKELTVPLNAVLAGGGEAASVVAGKRVNSVSVLESESLDIYSADGYCAGLRAAIEKLSPTLVLFPHPYQVRDFGPKLAASLDRPFVSDSVGVRADGGKLVFARQVYQGKLHADVVPAGDPPYFASLQSGAFRADRLEAGEDAAAIERISVGIDAAQVRTRAEAQFQDSKGEVDLSSAEIIVSVGRGIKEEDNIALARELAEAIGGELAASRPICDNGWLPLERQIGSSGQTVSPKLYLALGISGAIQHVVGMKGSKTIVAINRDPTAPIFEIADYGIAGDLFEVVPALTKALASPED